eukprot:4746769-Prymnesium_polylepis.1
MSRLLMRRAPNVCEWSWRHVPQGGAETSGTPPVCLRASHAHWCGAHRAGTKGVGRASRPEAMCTACGYWCTRRAFSFSISLLPPYSALSNVSVCVTH